MSYILDAIRKSDCERRRGQVPSVLDRHAAAAPVTSRAPAPRWLRPALLLAAGACLAGGIAAAAFSLAPRLWPDREATAERSAPATLAAARPPAAAPTPMATVATPREAARLPTPAAPTGEAVAAAAPAPVTAPGQPMVVVPPGTGWALLPMVPATGGAAAAWAAGGVPAVAVPAGAEADDSAGANENLTEEQIAAILDSHGAPRGRKPAPDRGGMAAPTGEDMAARSKPAGGGAPTWVAEARSELAAMAAAEKKANGRGSGLSDDAPPMASRSPETAAPPASRTSGTASQAVPTSAPTIDQLPASVRDALPAIVLSVHLYAADPKVRRVLVNNQSAHEGDSVGADLQVAAITRDGVIFRFKGTSFFLPANESWQPHSASAH